MSADGRPRTILPPFEILGRTVVHQGFSRLEVLEIAQVSRAGVTMRMKRELETHGDGAAVLAFDPARGRAILVRQLRVPVAVQRPQSAYLLECIAGLIDHAGDDAAMTARREAMEEAGVIVGEVTEIAVPFTLPGLSTERISLFLAEIDLSTARASAGGGLAEEHEDIEVVDIPLQELAEMADRGEILDLKTFALVQTLRLKRPDLFAS